LDSICPTGVGKVAGVKIEIDDERLTAGVEVTARFELLSAANNGISREKTRMAQEKRYMFMAHGRDYTVLRGFSRCRVTG
jgi:hypothetical protein